MGSLRLLRICIAVVVLLFASVSYFELTRLKRSDSVATTVEEIIDDQVDVVSDTVNQEHGADNGVVITNDVGVEDDILPHRVLFSRTTKDRQYMRVYLGNYPATNANVIPHPTKTSTWIVIAQRVEVAGQVKPSEQIACTAAIQNDFLLCAESVVTLELASLGDGNCTGNIEFIQFVWGPRDARVFYGPNSPYITYGAQSNYICFGQWMQDGREVLYQFEKQQYPKQQSLESAVELKRPSGYARVEKNYFIFWDAQGTAYVHHNIWPARSFSQLTADGSVSENLARHAEYEDQMCMAKFLPARRFRPHEDIHQATNSLSITLCKRSDPRCKVDDSNTFIMHIFHLKSFYKLHAVYEPYVMLFKRSSPFRIHAIGQRPFWIHGRNNLTAASDAHRYKDRPEAIPKGHTEMFYITSMSWNSPNQRYHGHIDDVLFLSFGIEDSRPGAIDVLADDLLQDLAFC